MRSLAFASALLLSFGLVSACSADDSGDADGPECVEIDDCGSNAVCVEGECVELCLTDEDCSRRADRCDPSLHVCVSCFEDSHCAASEFCGERECETDVCVAGERSCGGEGRRQRLCLENGGGYDETTCASRTTCVLENGTTECRPWVCTAGMGSCDATQSIATKCAADGLSEQVTDCAAMGQGCVNGACVPRICEPNGAVCRGETSYRCNASGTQLQEGDACVSSLFCDPSTGRCANDVCPERMPMCDGNVLRTCLPDGSGLAPGGTDCAAVPGGACEGNSCRRVVCTPGEYFCSEDLYLVYLCSAEGTFFTQEGNCGTGWYCDAGSPTCARQVCSPRSENCDGETIRTCNDSGSAFDSLVDDCGARGLLCSLSEGPAACAVEDAGGFNMRGKDYFALVNQLIANKYHVTTPRTLVGVAMNASGNPPVELTWVVYEAATADAAPRLVFQRTAPSIESGVQSSGAMNLALVAGRYYVVGVRPSHFFTFERADDSEYFLPMFSFGDWVGARSEIVAGALAQTLPAEAPEREPYVQRLIMRP